MMHPSFRKPQTKFMCAKAQKQNSYSAIKVNFSNFSGGKSLNSRNFKTCTGIFHFTFQGQDEGSCDSHSFSYLYKDMCKKATTLIPFEIPRDHHETTHIILISLRQYRIIEWLFVQLLIQIPFQMMAYIFKICRRFCKLKEPSKASRSCSLIVQ